MTWIRTKWRLTAGLVFFLLPARGAESRSVNVDATWGLEVLAAIAQDQRNEVLPILDCQLEGFRHDIDSPYRTSSAVLAAPNGRITSTVSKAGKFYPAFIFYDGPGDERISIFVNNVERGTAVAHADDNRQYLFFLREPFTFKGGEKIELRTLTPGSLYRTEDLFLLKEKPGPKRHAYIISEIYAVPQTSDGKAGARVTWITNWPAACTVEWQSGADGGQLTEKMAMNNHRVLLADLKPRQQYRYRVTGMTRDGKPAASEWRTFNTAPPPAIRERTLKAQVPIAVTPVDGDQGSMDFPLTAGIPFPKGALGSEAHLRILTPQNRELPVQAKTLARWPDGSVKWVLVDTQPSGSGTNTLEYGSSVSRKATPSQLKVIENPDTIAVVTGPLKFMVSKRRFGLFESVWLEGRKVISPERPASLHLTGLDGTVYTSLAPPDEIVVEQSGPMRAVLRVSGEHRAKNGRKLFAYTVRIHAYAGRSFLRVQYTFGNNSGATEFTSFRSLMLNLPLISSATNDRRRWDLGEGQREFGTFLTSRHIHLKQHSDDHYMISTVGGRPLAEGKRSPGWAVWSDGTHAVTVAVRDFWQNYPKDITVAPDGLELGLCPPLLANEYAEAKGTVDEYRNYFYLMEGAYKIRQGVQKTHDIWLDFERDTAQKKSSLLRSRHAPLFAVAPARWYVGSRAFGELTLPQPAGLVAQYDDVVERSFAVYLKARERNREYGWLNFGDWWGERGINWGNSEYDTQHSLLLQFARTGNIG